jgi:hypothetical protein
VGSQTEGALLVLLRDWAGQDFQKVRNGESGSGLHSLFLFFDLALDFARA